MKKPRMIMKTDAAVRGCGGCMHYVALAGSEKPEGVCRRFPPTPFLMTGGELKMQFPIVRADMICGEFRRY